MKNFIFGTIISNSSRFEIINLYRIITFEFVSWFPYERSCRTLSNLLCWDHSWKLFERLVMGLICTSVFRWYKNKNLYSDSKGDFGFSFGRREKKFSLYFHKDFYRLTHVIFYVGIITVINMVYKILHIYFSCLSSTRLGIKMTVLPL